MVVTERTALLGDELPREDDPRQWSALRKWSLAILVSNYAVMGPISGSMVVVGLSEISLELNLKSELATQLLVGIFVFGLCLGPLFMAPLSEIYGRSRVLNTGHCLFLLVNVLSALEVNGTRFLVLRFLGGLFGSGPNAIGTGMLSDLWSNEDRGLSLAIYTVLPLTGPAVGPILAQLIVDKTSSWRWIFWSSSMFIGATLLVGILFLSETFPPVLHKQRQKQKRQHGYKRSASPFTWARKLKKELPRPFILLGSQPIIQVLALYMGYLFGLNQLTIATFQSLWIEEYGQPKRTASLHYISIALGFVFGCQLAGPINDKIYSTMTRQNNGVGLPEFRVLPMIFASFLVPAGQLLYGWSAEWKLHWILPDAGIFTYSFGLIVGYQGIQSYILDCYPTYAASAIGALSLLRAIAGCIFPVLGPPIYRRLGYGFGSSLIATLAVIFGCPAPFLLKHWGPRLRAVSLYAFDEENNHG